MIAGLDRARARLPIALVVLGALPPDAWADQPTPVDVDLVITEDACCGPEVDAA